MAFFAFLVTIDWLTTNKQYVTALRNFFYVFKFTSFHAFKTLNIEHQPSILERTREAAAVAARRHKSTPFNHVPSHTTGRTHQNGYYDGSVLIKFTLNKLYFSEENFYC